MFQNGIMGLANVLALIAAVLITPFVDQWSAPFVMNTFIAVYGPDFAGLFRLAWFFIAGAAVFFAAQAGIAIALMMLSSWAVLRFGLLPI